MSDPSDFLERVEQVFHQVREFGESERESELDRLCAGDDALRTEVESMLEARSAMGGFLRSSVMAAAEDADSLIGRCIGAFTLRERIGEGAMGVIYKAVRTDGAYEQTVVVKLIRGIHRDRELERRFHRERQVLATLQHPAIARLLDGGFTEEGAPYLVMEHIDGEPITEFCDKRQAGIDARLELFDFVCAGAQHAHANLIVHRDLKPAHILVDSDGAPHLLDFGIATVIDDAGGPIERTITAQQRFTPQYASPEQMLGAPVTTATDVYALGLILYELLSGRRPYRVTGTDPEDSKRAVCETTPPTPSRRLATSTEPEESEDAGRIAQLRGTDVARLRKRLTGDLDTIVMTALRKDPERRYPSVEALREDVRRYRDGLPITARPESWSYLASKFVGRNRVGVAASLAVFIALIVGIIATAWQANIAAARAREAEAALQTSDTVESILRSILVSADPREGGQDMTVREALDQASATIDERLEGQPAVEARVRETLGATYRTLGDLTKATEQLEVAFERAAVAFGPGDPHTASIAHELAILRMDAGNPAEAEDLYRSAHDSRRSVLGPDHPDTLNSQNALTSALVMQSKFDEALSILEEIVERSGRILGPDAPMTLDAKNNLAAVLHEMGRGDEALTLSVAVYESQVRVLGEHHPDTLISANDIGSVLSRLGRGEDSIPWYERSIAGLAALYPAGSIDVAVPRINLVRVYSRIGRYAEAIELCERTLPDAVSTLGESHYVVAYGRLSLAACKVEVAEPDEAVRLIGLARPVLVTTFGESDSFIAEADAVLEKAGAASD